MLKNLLSQIQQIYRHHVLVEMLVQRELKARYRGTVLGLLWSFMNPLLLMITYTIVFSVYLRVEMENYAAFLLTGLLPWIWFVNGLGEGSSAILSCSSIIKKVHLPSEVFPLVYVLSNAVHFLFSLPLLLGLLYYTGIGLSSAVLFLPVVFVLQVIATYALTLVTSSVAAQFRDLLHIIPNVVLFLMFLTPIFYPEELVPEKYRIILRANPVSHIVDFYHDIFFYQRLPSWQHVAWVTTGILVFFLVSLIVFDRRKETFAEYI